MSMISIFTILVPNTSWPAIVVAGP